MLSILTTFLAVALVTFFFLFAFSLDRKYIYGMALVLLLPLPILMALKLDKFANYLGSVMYLLLVMGVLKDLFYDKIFEE